MEAVVEEEVDLADPAGLADLAEGVAEVEDLAEEVEETDMAETAETDFPVPVTNEWPWETLQFIE